MGNLRSVQKAFEMIGHEALITSVPNELARTDLLVLPGVGAFDKAVKNLRSTDLWEPIQDHLESNGAFLGICLGLQLLFEGSDEGDCEGFGYFDGHCRRFTDVEPVPHMGWNDVEWSLVDDFHTPGTDEPQSYYFVHSFYPDPLNSEVVAGRTDYGTTFCCAARAGNVFGVQFHPEKSQFAGLDLLSSYVEYLQSTSF